MGSLVLPDGLPSGNYRFVADTNMKLDDKVDGQFTQQIIIKSITASQLIIRFNSMKWGSTKNVFNTGDLQGKFKIVFQGLTSEGVAYGA